MSIKLPCRKHDIGEPAFFSQPRPLRREGALGAHRLKDAESKPHAARSHHAAKPEIPACIGTHAVGRNHRWTRDRANGARSGKSKRDCSRRWPRAIRRAGGNRMRPGRIAKTASATVNDRHGMPERIHGWDYPSGSIGNRDIVLDLQHTLPSRNGRQHGHGRHRRSRLRAFCVGRDVGQRCLGYVRLEIIMPLRTYRHAYPGMRPTPRQWQSCTQYHAA